MNETNFIFNGVDSATYNIAGNPLLPLLPTRRRNTIEVPGRDGVYDFGNNSYYPLYLPIDCTIKPADRAAKPGDLANTALWLMGEGALVLGRDTTKRWVSAKVYDQVDLRHVGKNAQFQVIFECNPPWLEDVDAQAGSIGTATDYGSQLPFSPAITVTKTGDPAASLTLALLSTGEYMQIVTAIVAGDVIVFNMGTGKVTLNGVSCMGALTIGSTPFAVPAGSQTVTVTTTGTYTATMSFRRRYVYA